MIWLLKSALNWEISTTYCELEKTRDLSNWNCTKWGPHVLRLCSSKVEDFITFFHHDFGHFNDLPRPKSNFSWRCQLSYEILFVAEWKLRGFRLHFPKRILNWPKKPGLFRVIKHRLYLLPFLNPIGVIWYSGVHSWVFVHTTATWEGGNYFIFIFYLKNSE